jgi:hypothetical protein
LTVLVKAGSRFESKEGVANALKNFAFKVRSWCTFGVWGVRLTGGPIPFHGALRDWFGRIEHC